MKTSRRSAIWLVLTMLTSACSTLRPVAVQCPQPPPVPQILTQPVSAERPLIEDWQQLMESYRKALSESFAGAIRQ